MMLHDEVRRRSQTPTEMKEKHSRSSTNQGSTADRRGKSPNGTGYSRAIGCPEGRKLGSCNWCGSVEHWQRECPDLATELQRSATDRKNEGKASANLVEDNESNVDKYFDSETSEIAANVIETTLATVGIGNKTGWYLVSGASSHVTGNKSF